MERGCEVGNTGHEGTCTRGSGKKSNRVCHGSSSLAEVTSPDKFSSDLLEYEESGGFSAEELAVPHHGCSPRQVCDGCGDDGGGDGGEQCLSLEETPDEEAEFTEQDV